MLHRESSGRGQSAFARASLKAGALLGAGVMAGIDEIIFHQVLAWHHFYDRSTSDIGLLSDGLLHAAEMIMIVAGSCWLLDLARTHRVVSTTAVTGLLLGSGSFQLFDGLINHKVLRLHQIRYVDNVLPYDVVWNLFAGLLILAGLIRYSVSPHRSRS